MISEEVQRIILKKAKELNCSIHVAAKSYFHYMGGDFKKRCYSCTYATKVNYSSRRVLQCQIMGISGDAAADVEGKMVCEKFKINLGW